jgi:hypothetical protein
MAGADVVAAAEVAEEGVVLTASEMGKPEEVVVLKEKKVKAVVSKEMKTTKVGNVAAAHPSYLLVLLSFRRFYHPLLHALSLSDCEQCLLRFLRFFFRSVCVVACFSLGFLFRLLSLSRKRACYILGFLRGVFRW